MDEWMPKYPVGYMVKENNIIAEGMGIVSHDVIYVPCIYAFAIRQFGLSQIEFCMKLAESRVMGRVNKFSERF